jgi:hypothetical protein
MGSATGKTARHRDPMFWCLLGAMVLAIGSSVTLRLVVRHAGPSAARAADAVEDEEGLQLAPEKAPESRRMTR